MAVNNVKIGAQSVNDLLVKYSHIAKPDLEYNSGHSVTVVVNENLKNLQKEVVAQTGVKKLNGIKKTDEGEELASFRTKVFVNEGKERFPNVFDMEGQRTMDVPFGGDTVNLVIKPKVVEMNNKHSISFYLQEVQVVEKQENGKVTFAKPKAEQTNTETTFESQSTENSESDLPF